MLGSYICTIINHYLAKSQGMSPEINQRIICKVEHDHCFIIQQSKRILQLTVDRLDRISVMYQ